MSYRIDPSMPLTLEVRRIAGETLDVALAHLAAVEDKPDRALHQCRRRLKDVRGLLRLVRSGNEAFFRAENARYRDAAGRLAGAREAAALIETVDLLMETFPKQAAEGAFDGVRARLVERRGQVLDDKEALAAAIAASSNACKAGLSEFEALILPDRPEEAADVLAKGARAMLRKARRALEKARADGDQQAFHTLRTAAKTHAMHLQLLRGLWPSAVAKRSEAVDVLGDRLGELHDISVLRDLLASEDEPLGAPAETRLLDRLAKRSQRKLKKKSLSGAAELFSGGSRRTARKLARKCRHHMAKGMASIRQGKAAPAGAS